MAELREYELLYILKPTVPEDQIPASIEKVNRLVANNGGEVYEVLSTAPWGRRRLAYEIDRFQDGFYVLNHLHMDGAKADEIERQLKISDDVMRFLLTRQDL